MFKVNELLKATQGKLISGKEDLIVKGISIDSRTINPQEAFIAIKGDNFDGHDFIQEAIKKGASCIIIEPQVKSYDRQWKAGDGRKVVVIGVKDTKKALGDIARFQRTKFNIPIIAVTGSNGKTTTKEMIAWILSKKYNVLKNQGTKNNHIGLPVTLMGLSSYYDIAVLEIGTNHPGEVEYLARICQPNIGIITNVGPVHLEYFHNLESVFKEKYTLIENLRKPFIAILNADDGLVKKEVVKENKRPVILGFGIKNQSDFFASDIKVLNEKIKFRVNQKYKFTLNTQGYHNIYNALTAIAVARIFGLGYESIASRLSTFEFPQSRLKFIKLNKIKFIDDTYNSNPVSLKYALDTLENFNAKGRKIFVMGDMLELGSYKKVFHHKIGKDVVGICDIFITVGKLSKLSAKAAESSGFDIKNIFTCTSCQEAADILVNKIRPSPEDIVLVKGSRAMRMEEVFKHALSSTISFTQYNIRF